jgi:hypothetical protein
LSARLPRNLLNLGVEKSIDATLSILSAAVIFVTESTQMSYGTLFHNRFRL